MLAFMQGPGGAVFTIIVVWCAYVLLTTPEDGC